MGLDMYAWKIKPTELDGGTDDNTDLKLIEKGPKPVQLHYWRKHPDLHGWMERLYREKGGAAEMFNCTSVRLTLEDLDRLEDDIKNYRLPKTSGFFFGESHGDETTDDLNFVKDAKQAIAEGYIVYYDSWW